MEPLKTSKSSLATWTKAEFALARIFHADSAAPSVQIGVDTSHLTDEPVNLL